MNMLLLFTQRRNCSLVLDTDIDILDRPKRPDYFRSLLNVSDNTA